MSEQDTLRFIGDKRCPKDVRLFVLGDRVIAVMEAGDPIPEAVNVCDVVIMHPDNLAEFNQWRAGKHATRKPNPASPWKLPEPGR